VGYYRNGGLCGAGHSRLAVAAKELYVFQRTPSSIDIRDDWATDPNWARRLKPGWQAKRRERALMGPQLSEEEKTELASLSRQEKISRQENANIEYMMRIHRRHRGDRQRQSNRPSTQALVHVHV